VNPTNGGSATAARGPGGHPPERESPLAGVEVVLVTGMSGAGRSSAARALEDLGWFVVDNLPPQLLVDTLVVVSQSDVDRVAVVADARGGRLFSQLRSAIDDVRAQGADLRILYLEATDDALVRRFESSRRPHPLQSAGGLLAAIVAERVVLGDVRAAADLIIDTSQRSIHDLRRAIDEAFESGDQPLRATLLSFGFKYGIPADADFVADVRFLPNPYWIPELSPLTGREAPVSEYVLAQRGAEEFLDTLTRLVGLVTEGYLAEGKRFAMIAVGCTGGKHRSVAMVEELAVRLAELGLAVSVVHRDLGRE
jgi:RNase adapter protein RapZ